MLILVVPTYLSSSNSVTLSPNRKNCRLGWMDGWDGMGWPDCLLCMTETGRCDNDECKRTGIPSLDSDPDSDPDVAWPCCSPWPPGAWLLLRCWESLPEYSCEPLSSYPELDMVCMMVGESAPFVPNSKMHISSGHARLDANLVLVLAFRPPSTLISCTSAKICGVDHFQVCRRAVLGLAHH